METSEPTPNAHPVGSRGLWLGVAILAALFTAFWMNTTVASDWHRRLVRRDAFDRLTVLGAAQAAYAAMDPEDDFGTFDQLRRASLIPPEANRWSLVPMYSLVVFATEPGRFTIVARGGGIYKRDPTLAICEDQVVRKAPPGVRVTDPYYGGDPEVDPRWWPAARVGWFDD